MSMQRVDKYPHLFRDTLTGKIYNERDFHKFDRVETIHTWGTDHFTPAPGDYWIIEECAVLLHPWPEIIPSGLKFTLEISGSRILDAVTLRAVAEPHAHNSLVARVDKLEQILHSRLNSEAIPPDHVDLRRMNQTPFVNSTNDIYGKISGDVAALTCFHEHVRDCELVLRGKVRKVVR